MNSTPANPTGPLSAQPADRPHVITRRAVVGWVLYDLANTIFSMGVISMFFSLWVRDEVGQQRADSVYGLITAFSMGIIFVVSPLLGAMTDRARRRMPFLVVSTVLCVGLTALLGRWGWWPTVICFVVANVAYQAGLQFYDAMLPEVSTEANRGRIGGIGVGIGYLGSYLAVALAFLVGTKDKPLLFTLIAIAFLIFALPCMIFVRERGNPRPRPINLEMVRTSTQETLRTLRSGRDYPGLIRFLVGRAFYTDAINTVITFMTLFTINVALHNGRSKDEGEQTAKFIMMAAITSAVTGGFFWGWLADRRGPKWTLNVVLSGWMGIFGFAALVGLAGLPLWCMYVVAITAGFALGGVWSADRPYMLRLTPPNRVGEFYGLYGMVGRFSAISGPILWTATFWAATRFLHFTELQAQGLSVLVLLAMILLSSWILAPVSDQPRDWSRLGAARAPESPTPATPTRH